MKPAWLTPVMLRDFRKLQGIGVAVAVLALIPWLAQDFVSSLAATQMTTQTKLRTTEEKNDARVTQAFESARRNHRAVATLATEQNPRQETRDSLLTITAGSKREALAELATMVAAMQASFKQNGGGELYDVGHRPYAIPIPNEQSTLLRLACRWSALLILVGGLVLMADRLRNSGLPSTAILAIVGGLTGGAILLMGGPFVWIFGLPIALLVMVAVLTRRVHRAATWVEGKAQITKSRVVVKHHQFSGEETKVTNTAFVAYDFSVGSQLFHGDRISLGFAPADQVNETLKRYPVGATVPVFYDPANPAECVLERKPPASLGCIWSGAITVVLVYLAVLLSIGKSEFIVDRISFILEAMLPRIHHPIAMILSGLFGLFCIGSWLWNRRHVHKAFPWLATKGRIVSSKTESYLDFDGRGGGSQHRYYHALVEFAYMVEGQEYHNTVSEPGTSQASAEAETARYISGAEVKVRYDPKTPTNSALKVNDTLVIDGRASLVVGLACLALAIYLALP